jgi:hypothetical protein
VIEEAFCEVVVVADVIMVLARKAPPAAITMTIATTEIVPMWEIERFVGFARDESEAYSQYLILFYS